MTPRMFKYTLLPFMILFSILLTVLFVSEILLDYLFARKCPAKKEIRRYMWEDYAKLLGMIWL